MSTTKEMKEKLKARVIEHLERGRAHRETHREAKAAGDTDKVNANREEWVFDHRPDARDLLLAYAYLRGKTYRQVEPKTAEGNEPESCWIGYRLEGWDELDDYLYTVEWVEAGDKTRFELRAEDDEAELEEPEPVPMAAPKPKGVLERLRAAVGVGA